MRRLTLITLAAGMSAALGACQPAEAPATADTAEPAATAAAPAQAGVATPATYDWSFLTHGGSGDLDFGDGDWAEGVSLISMSCLPASGRVSVTRAIAEGQPAEIGLAAGDTAETLRPGAGPVEGSLSVEVAADGPLMQAFRREHSLTLTTADGPQVLAARGEGRDAIEQFFAYCG